MTKPETKPGVLQKLKHNQQVLALVLLLVLAAGFAAFKLYHQMIDSSRRQQAMELAAQYALDQQKLADKYLTEQRQQIAELSQRDVFQEAVFSDDQQELASAEELLREWAPDLQDALLLTANDPRLIERHHYAGQLLVANTLTGKIEEPAAALIGGKWQLLFCYPLKNTEGTVGGALLAILSPEKLTELLQTTPAAKLGTTELVQTRSGAKVTSFLSTGSKSRALEPVSRNLAFTNWQLRYSGDDRLISNSQPSYTLFAAVLLVLLAATALVIYLILRFTPQVPRNKIAKAKAAKIRHDIPPEDPVDDAGESFLDIIPSTTGVDKRTADTPAEQEKSDDSLIIPPIVFRDYDIRGIANQQISPTFANRLGRVLANRALALGEHSLIIGRDGRQTSEALCAALAQGIIDSGCNIIDLGPVPTPLLNFATHQLQQSDCGVMVTASHNPAEYNGFKMFFQHHALCGEEIRALGDEMSSEPPSKSQGQRNDMDLSGDYIQSIVADIVPAQGLKVILDAGNGIAGELGVRLLEAIGCDVIPLYCDVDGTFPNHDPDPSVPGNLDDLVLFVKDQGADLGIALDGDGDRIVAVSASGRIIWPDELLMIFARDVVSRHPGADVVFDIKSTRRLNSLISSYGGRPVMWKTGHSHMYNKIIESKAPLGGEFSGHIFFHDRWHGFDDGLYAAARLIEIINIREQGLDDIMASFETRVATPEIRIDVSEEAKFNIVERLRDNEAFKEGNVCTIDGVRVDFPKAWGLVRASNTGPALTLRFEADSNETLEKIQSLFRQQLRSIDSNLTF
ncbi:MAG: hypothetical protein R3E57_11490 [Porticoccaceae bacterium]